VKLTNKNDFFFISTAFNFKQDYT